MDPRDADHAGKNAGPRPRRLQSRATCELCGTDLPAGTLAQYDRATKKVRCLACPVEHLSIDAGVAGGSARREFERRKAKREAEAKGRFGARIGGVIVALTNEPQSTRAWATGARGEALLGAALAGVSGIVVLHDRGIPGTKANIDHVVIATAGVFVVDAKRLTGQIRVRNRGNLFHRDDRLYVGGHDRSRLADGVVGQAQVVQAILEATGAVSLPSVTPVLCFIDGDWPLFNPPTSFRGVRLETERTLKKVVGGETAGDPEAFEWATRVLGSGLPAR
jgi:hypothetical protein